MGTAGDFFIGFGQYNCKKELWDRVFYSTETWADLCSRFAISGQSGFDTILNIDATQLARRLNGSEGWGKYADHFLSYRQNYNNYCTYWLAHVFSPPEWKEIFQMFQASIPSDADCPPEHKNHLAPARRVSAYLDAVLTYCEAPWPEDGNAWFSAGMYVLICLFIQNGKRCIPQYYEPPAPYTLAQLKEAIQKKQQTSEANDAEKNSTFSGKPSIETVTVFPQGTLYAPENPELPFDFFAYVRSEFEKSAGEEAEDWILDATMHMSELDDFMITPAEIHRKPVTVTRTIVPPAELYGTHNIGVLLMDDILICENHQWQLLLKLRIPPYTHCRTFDREFHIENRQLDDTGSRLMFLTECDGLVSASPLFHLTSSQMYYLNDTDFIPQRSILQLEIDESGQIKDRHMEKMLAIFAIPKESASPFSHRKATAKLDLEYLHYFIVDTETMTEIPKTKTYNPSTGAPELSITIPCPCKLAVIKTPKRILSLEKARQLELSGLLHGFFGLARNTSRAVEYMSVLADQDTQMAFQYGAYLKKNGMLMHVAEKYLRAAANADIPGAKFELAELLLAQKETDSARLLIQELWRQGYRTYGPIRSIDLLGDYTQNR